MSKTHDSDESGTNGESDTETNQGTSPDVDAHTTDDLLDANIILGDGLGALLAFGVVELAFGRVNVGRLFERASLHQLLDEREQYTTVSLAARHTYETMMAASTVSRKMMKKMGTENKSLAMANDYRNGAVVVDEEIR